MNHREIAGVAGKLKRYLKGGKDYINIGLLGGGELTSIEYERFKFLDFSSS